MESLRTFWNVKTCEFHYKSLLDKYTWKAKLHLQFKNKLHISPQLYKLGMIKYLLNEKEISKNNMRKKANKNVQMTRGLPLLPAQRNFLIRDTVWKEKKSLI